MAKSMTMYIEIDLEDEQKLREFANKVYKENCNLDLEKEMENYPNETHKTIRSIFEVLIGSGDKRPYYYSEAGFTLTGFGDE